jgi:hypothetical protein
MPTKEIRITVSQAKHVELSEVKGDRTWKEAMFEEFGVDNE